MGNNMQKYYGEYLSIEIFGIIDWKLLDSRRA